MTILAFIAGLLLLIIGAEGLVKGASRLAVRFGMSPLLIGLTVVAFGTSSPELAVSLKAAIDDQAGIALGNVVGSNVFNVLFILGVSALIVPLTVAQQLIRFDIPLMVGLSLLVLLLVLDGSVGRLDGGLLVIGLAAYLLFLFRQSRREPSPESSDEHGPEGARLLNNLAYVVGGLGMLVLGSRWLVGSVPSSGVTAGEATAAFADCYAASS